MTLNCVLFMFGNGDCVKVDGKYVGRFFVDETRHTISRVTIEEFCIMDVAHEFGIEIYKDANVDFYEFEDEETEPVKLFERFKENDLAAINFSLNDDEGQVIECDFSLPWSDKDEYTNENQETLESKFGHLYITVNDTGEKNARFKQSDIDQKGTNQMLAEMIRANKAKKGNE